MMQHIQANGIDIAYRIDGPAVGAANAPVVILSNSLMSSHARALQHCIAGSRFGGFNGCTEHFERTSDWLIDGRHDLPVHRCEPA
jgi:hypothetical protein